jgi:diketogulonate reductase-like aldo/keto reductase
LRPEVARRLTSRISGQNYATSEQTTGEVLAELKPERSSYWLTTKLSNPPGIEGQPGATPIAVADVRSSVEGSLKRLGTKPNLLLIHNPFVVPSGELEPFWRELEALTAAGEPLEGVSLGVSNFRPQDLEALLSFAKVKPVCNQIEYHPWTAVHSAPILALHAKHGIHTQSYGPLVPVLKAKNGGALKPVLDRIAKRLDVDSATVLLLWVRAKGATAVSSSGNEGRIRQLSQTARMATDVLTADDVRDIDEAGSKTHYRCVPGRSDLTPGQCPLTTSLPSLPLSAVSTPPTSNTNSPRRTCRRTSETGRALNRSLC